MCGIVGFSGAPDSDVLKKMTDSIFHRGPDDEGFIVNSAFSVGFRRLAIVDLTSSIYPITNEEGTIKVVLNGEIYNYEKLRVELQDLGHKFKTSSDTEVIAHGFEEWGKDVVKRLRGMFVIVLYDERNQELFISRDRVGIKPLYYTEFDGRVVFSSEIKGILSGFNVDRSANDANVMKFLAYRVHDVDETTFFINIKRLLSGHMMTIKSDGSFVIEKYWNPTYSSKFASTKSDDEYANEFRERFLETVKLHLISDVPVGTTLSGGLDSSGVTSLAAKFYKENKSDQKLYSFSAVHPGETVNEEGFIDSVVEYTGVESIKVTPNVDEFWNELDLWTYFQEEPVISGAPYAYYVVMREARKHVTVILSGQGGDELLAGYIPYFMSYWHSAWDQGKPLKALSELFAGRDLYSKFILMKLDSYFKKSNQIKSTSYLSSEMLASLEIPRFVHKRNLNERLFEDVTSSTTQCLLRYEDKNSMANSLESRVPFYDHEMVEYIFNLPMDQKIKQGWNRFVYRNAMKGLMPDRNRLRRSKIGFTNPEWEWIERKKDRFLNIFDSEQFRSRKYWDADKVIDGFNKALSGEMRGDILFFWRLFSVEMWLRTFVDDFHTRDTKEYVHFR